ncbi:type I restriction endonuclease subunit R [Armatimonas sp.]|uniref:type I restriction endonuclease subunit R n=1 Tax=Armatimonas sp. TaxID=1872638 RepID=UPI00374D3CEE
MSERTITKEVAFEEHITTHLAQLGGWEQTDSTGYVKSLALDTKQLLGFLQETQPDSWARLTQIHGLDNVEKRFLLRMMKELDSRGMLDVLRYGVVDYSVRFKLAYFKPSTTLNEEAKRLYDLNRLTIVRQLHYSEKTPNDALDLTFFLNGLPIATAELKNHLTGQRVADAVAQYRKDRDPRELLFSFKRRVLVHFAVDPDEVQMTTKLSGKETRFLPFNKGDQGGAGNPVNPKGHRSAYLWEEVLPRDSFLDLLGRFCHLQQEEYRMQGRLLKKESLIFPRYHQREAVYRLESVVLADGVGNNYLVQHSAGSGKSNTIAWLAHRLSTLHDSNNEPIFGSVVVLTDRRVLDRQLQDTIYQFDHSPGTVACIDKDSQQLGNALVSGVKIIVTTLQKFPFIVDRIEELESRRYAVIVDEAHSSQTGEAADKVKEVLSAGYSPSEEEPPSGDEDELTLEDIIREKMRARKARQPNMSFFAFTATPKPKTLAAFGQPGTDGKPHAFHLYSMRQAIEEGFILDVLRGYITYERYHKLTKAILDDPELSKKSARRAAAYFVDFHPHNLSQKVQIIVEHFRSVVRNKIGGQAKAMVVTGSRLMAVRYKQTIDEYITEKSYKDIRTLVAFSGKVTDDFDLEFTEAQMNGFPESQLPEQFSGEEYQVLIVAEKYQTGFDQPLLHTMYVDRKLSGVRAVQTLSRLNRTHPGKEDTLVLDFANTPEEILTAFQPYYEATTIESEIDPNLIYDLKHKEESFQVTRQEELDGFARVFFARRTSLIGDSHGAINRFLDPAVERFQALATEEQREQYKTCVISFVRLYSFLSQVAPFDDTELEIFYAYARLLISKLPNEKTIRFSFDDEIALEYYRLQKMTEGTIALQKSGEAGLRVVSEVGTGEADEQTDKLSNIINVLNERFGTEFKEADRLFFEQIERDMAADEVLAQQAKTNTIENFRFPFDEKFVNAVIDRMEINQEITDRLLNEEQFSEIVRELLLRRVYENLRRSE